MLRDSRVARTGVRDGPLRCRKIRILGAAGSGKSHVAAGLSEKCDIPAFDLDDIFWDNRAGGYGVMAPVDEQDEGLGKILERDSWIIEGVYCRWAFESIEEADIIIVLTTPVWLRDWRIVTRFLKRKLGLIPSKKKETLAALYRLIRRNHRYESESLPFARSLIEIMKLNAVDCRTPDDVFRALAPEGAANEAH